jgi:hypothetical protein
MDTDHYNISVKFSDMPIVITALRALKKDAMLSAPSARVLKDFIAQRDAQRREEDNGHA